VWRELGPAFSTNESAWSVMVTGSQSRVWSDPKLRFICSPLSNNAITMHWHHWPTTYLASTYDQSLVENVASGSTKKCWSRLLLRTRWPGHSVTRFCWSLLLIWSSKVYQQKQIKNKIFTFQIFRTKLFFTAWMFGQKEINFILLPQHKLPPHQLQPTRQGLLV
jgi:hypothetical protein